MFAQFSLKDKVIVVTGGTGVLGAAFIQAITSAGGIPVILGRNKEVARERADQVKQQGGGRIGSYCRCVKLGTVNCRQKKNHR